MTRLARCALTLTTALSLCPPVALAEEAGKLLLASQVAGVVIAPLAALPAAPKPSAGLDECRHLTVEAPSSAAGLLVAEKGWSVTGEGNLGPYSVVSFIGDAEPATSGTCLLLQGNIGFWSGDDLVAVIYGLEGGPSIGGIYERSNGLRISTGELLSSTLGDLQLIGGRDILLAPPGGEVACGSAELPFIEGLPIDMARKLLIEKGWQPEIIGGQGIGMAETIAKTVPEVEDCAGTGFAQCAFAYTHPAARLSVITAGEIAEDGTLPSVIGTSTSCIN